jgi:type III secretion system (T3SS) SseB-like protein
VGWRRRRPAEPSLDEFLGRSFLVPLELRLAAEDEEDVFLSAFSSRECLERFAPDSSSAAQFSGVNVLEFVVETDCAGVVVDPGDDRSFSIPRAVAEQIVGPSSDALWEGPKILLAPPDHAPPASLVEALRNALSADDDVVGAYVFLAALPGREAHPQAVLGIHLVAGDELSDALIAALQRCVLPPAEATSGLGGYASLDIRVLDDDLLDSARELGILVYERSGS